MTDDIPEQDMRRIEQCRQWINGTPNHNTVDDECCPDFSCCHPNSFILDRQIRIAYFNMWALKKDYPLWRDS